MQKGFIRIFETIIASIILLSAFSAFLNPIKTSSNWNNVFIQSQAEDVLAATYKNEAQNNSLITGNFDDLYVRIKNVLPATVDLVSEVTGIPNSEIRVGCACSDQEYDDIINILSPHVFKFKHRTIRFVLKQDTFANIANDNDTNVVFMLRMPTGSEISDVDKSLAKGKTVFALADMTSAYLTSNPQTGVIFGLVWDSGGGRPSERSNFCDSNDACNPDDPTKISFKINNYFINSSFLVNTTNGPKTFYISKDPYTMNTWINVTVPCVEFPSPPLPNRPTCYKVGDMIPSADIGGWDVVVWDIDAETAADPEKFANLSIMNRAFDFKGFGRGTGGTPLNKIIVDEKTIIKTSNGFSTVKVNLSGNGRTVWFANYDEDDNSDHSAESDINQLVRATMLWASGERFRMTDSDVPGTQPLYNYNYVGILDGYEVYEMKLIVWRLFY